MTLNQIRNVVAIAERGSLRSFADLFRRAAIHHAETLPGARVIAA